MHICRPTDIVLIVKLGQNKPGMIKPYSCKENLFLAVPGFPGKLDLCNNSCTTLGICTNADVLFPNVTR